MIGKPSRTITTLVMVAMIVGKSLDLPNRPGTKLSNEGICEHETEKIPLEQLLVRERKIGRKHLKRRLISEGILQPICARCGIKEWMGQPIMLELHHINGINDDQRLENLSLLCPNCHSQTETYCGRNVRLKRARQKSQH